MNKKDSGPNKLSVLIYGGAMVFLGAFWGGVAGFFFGNTILFALLGIASACILMFIVLNVNPGDF